MKNIITLILKRSDQTHYQSFEFKYVLGVLTQRPIPTVNLYGVVKFYALVVTSYGYLERLLKTTKKCWIQLC